MSAHPEKIKHYRILSELSAGSGTLLANDEAVKRKVVLKALRPDALATAPELQEFRNAVKRLSQNAAVQVARTVELLQLKTDGATSRYLVREYREGLSLETTLARKSALGADEAARVMARTAQVVADMHAAGVVHGNLCAANVILDLQGKIQLVDYTLPPGAASRPYVAPEVAAGGRPGQAADIFALGVLYCRLLTGQFPPSGALPESAMTAAGSLGDLLGRMLQEDPARRPESAAHVAALFQNPPPPRTIAAPAPLEQEPAPGRAAASATAPKPVVAAAASAPKTRAAEAAAPASRPTAGDEPSKNVDWDRVMHLVGPGMRAEPQREETRRAKAGSADALHPLPQRASETAGPRQDDLASHRNFYRTVTVLQFLFVTWAVGFLLFTISRQALQGSSAAPAVSVASTPGGSTAVYTTGATGTAPAPAPAAAPAIQPSATPPATGDVPFEAEMRTVPAGECVFYNSLTNKRERVTLEAFQIDRYEVTNAEFLKFTRDTGYISDGNWQRYFLPGMERYPVGGVSFKDAVAYAKWTAKRLPTAQEWQKACGGPEGKPFPWGPQFDPARCSWMSTQKPVAVDSFPEGQSPYGVFNMAGNAWEWVSDSSAGRRYVMGGSYNSDGLSLGTFARMPVPAEGFRPTPDIGFRCAK